MTKNIDNTRTAYFSYNNLFGREITLTNNQALGTINIFRSGGAPISDQPPVIFKAGQSNGTIIVRFLNGSVTWVVKAEGSKTSEATASEQSPECPPIRPLAECRGYEKGEFTARLGYENQGSFEQVIPVGKSNGFSPGAVDLGQPTRFFSGVNRAAFDIPVLDPDVPLTWNINDKKLVIGNQLETCAGRCVDVPVGAIKGDLDQVAIDLSALMNKAAELLVSVKDQDSMLKKISPAKSKARSRRDAARSGRKAFEYERIAKALLIQYPAVVKICPQAPQFCMTVDRQGTIDALRGLYANQRNSVIRVIARVLFRSTGATSRKQQIVKDARALEQKGLEQLKKLPRFATECK